MIAKHEKIVELITLASLTQTELADVLDRSQPYVQKALKKGFKEDEQEKIIVYVKNKHLNIVSILNEVLNENKVIYESKQKEIEKILSEVDHD